MNNELLRALDYFVVETARRAGVRIICSDGHHIFEVLANNKPIKNQYYCFIAGNDNKWRTVYLSLDLDTTVDELEKKLKTEATRTDNYATKFI